MWLAGHGGLAPEHLAYLREVAAEPRHLHPECLPLLWQYEGEEAVEAVLAHLLDDLADDALGSRLSAALAGMGAAAAPAVPALRAVARRATRIDLYTGDFDQEMRADEMLAAAAGDALRRITEAVAAGPGDRR